MSNLPRRLADDRHVQYEELLRQHFERQLSAEITPQMQMQGWTVISKEDLLLMVFIFFSKICSKFFPNFPNFYIPKTSLFQGAVSERDAPRSLFHAAGLHGPAGPQAGLGDRCGGRQRPGAVAGCRWQPGATCGGGAGEQEGPAAGGGTHGKPPRQNGMGMMKLGGWRIF